MWFGIGTARSEPLWSRVGRKAEFSAFWVGWCVTVTSSEEVLSVVFQFRLVWSQWSRIQGRGLALTQPQIKTRHSAPRELCLLGLFLSRTSHSGLCILIFTLRWEDVGCVEDADKISTVTYSCPSDLLGSLPFGRAWGMLVNRGLHRLIKELSVGQGL